MKAKMKKKELKTIVWCIFLVILWIIPDFFVEIKTLYFVGLIGFAFVLIVIKCIKNKAASLLIAFITCVLITLVDNEYIFLAVPALLIAGAHNEAVETFKQPNKKDGQSNVYLTFSTMIIFAQIVYSIVIYVETDYHNLWIAFMKTKIIVLFIFLFGSLLLASRKNTSVVNKKTVNALFSFIYIVIIAGIVVNLIYYYSKNATANSVNEFFVYWYILLLFVVMNDDPYVNYAILKLKKHMESI